MSNIKRNNENSLHKQLMRRIMNEKMSLPPQSITPPTPQQSKSQLQSQGLRPLTMFFTNAKQTLYRKPRQMRPPPAPPSLPSPPPFTPRPTQV